MTSFLRLYILLSFLFSASCVSIDLAPEEGEPAEDLQISAPGAPFKLSKQEGPVTSWINRKNGNTISIYSVCNDGQDLPLKDHEKESLNSLENGELMESREITYNNRRALESKLKGSVDGVPVRMQLLLLKKNRCFYNLAYIGVEKSFASNLEIYKQFIKGFKAP